MAGQLMTAPAAATRAPSLTSALVRLQLKLFWRLTKSSTAQLVGSIVMALLVLGSVIPAMWGLVAMRGASVEFRGVLLTLGFALLTLMWPIAVTLMTGNNDMLDAGRFSLYPVRMLPMLPGLVISAAMGLGGVLTLLLGIGYVAAWSTSPGTLLAAVVGLVLGFATCLVSSRALSSVLAGVLRRRKARDLVMVGMVLLILLLSFGIQIASRVFAQDAVNGGATISLDQLVASAQAVAGVAAWTPFGWAWGLPWAVAQGAWGTAVVWLVLGLAWLAGCAWVWTHMFAQTLISPLESAGGAQKIAKANPIDRFIPETPAGAIAKRELRYWRRDPRRLVGALAMFLMPFMMLVPVMVSVSSDPTAPAGLGRVIAAYCPAMLSWMAAVFVSMDISYDGSAIASQIAAGVSGRDDRWGRALAFLIIFGAVELVYVLGFMAYSRHWELLPAVLGASFGLLFVGAGIGSWMGSMWQMAQPPAGSSLMGRSGAGGVAGFLSSMVGMFLPIVIVAPVLVLAVLAAVIGPMYGWIALAVGAAEGWFFLWWGVRSGGRRLDRTWPEVLVKVTWKG